MKTTFCAKPQILQALRKGACKFRPGGSRSFCNHFQKIVFSLLPDNMWFLLINHQKTPSCQKRKCKLGDNTDEKLEMMQTICDHKSYVFVFINCAVFSAYFTSQKREIDGAKSDI